MYIVCQNNINKLHKLFCPTDCKTFQNVDQAAHIPEGISQSYQMEQIQIFLGCTITQLKNNSKPIQYIKSRNYDVIEINKRDTSLSFRSVNIPKLQIFVKIFCTNLQSAVWSCHVGVLLRDTNMAARKQCKHLELFGYLGHCLSELSKQIFK